MNIENAVNRFKRRMENGSWKSNQKDIDALNEFIRYVNAKESEQFDNNELFAKLYINMFRAFRKMYDNPIKELHRLLEQPLSVHIQNFTDKLNDIEVENLFDELNLSKKHPSTIPKELQEKEMIILQQAVKDQGNKDKLFRNVWKPENVREILSNQINNFLNTYNHDKAN